ncbi:MAG: polysaccharide deacetylase family protein [Rhizobiaceae bacterium]|nr:polysaccharide deacetylase family protein [Rhizobiaceae bacterium]
MSLGITFHHFIGAGHPAIQGAISADELERFIRRQGVHNFLDAQDWVEASQRGTLRTGQYCLTFDDSLLSQIDVALPVLDALRKKAFFFVYSSILDGEMEMFEVYRYFRNMFYESVDDFYGEFFAEFANSGLARPAGPPGREKWYSYLNQYAFYSENDRKFRYIRDCILSKHEYESLMIALMRGKGADPRSIAAKVWMTSAAVRSLADADHVVGLHSHTHPTNMGMLPYERQYAEYSANERHLTKILGKRPTTMAHPSGSYNAETLAILRGMGVTLGFRSDTSSGGGSQLEQPRIDHTLFSEAGQLRSVYASAS